MFNGRIAQQIKNKISSQKNRIDSDIIVEFITNYKVHVIILFSFVERNLHPRYDILQSPHYIKLLIYPNEKSSYLYKPSNYKSPIERIKQLMQRRSFVHRQMRCYIALGEQLFENFHSIRISGMSKRFKSREDLALRPENVFISWYPIEHIIFPEFDRSAFARQTEFKEEKRKNKKKKGKKRKVEKKKETGEQKEKGKKKGKWERTEGKDDEKEGTKRNGEKRNEEQRWSPAHARHPIFCRHRLDRRSHLSKGQKTSGHRP